jgi:hypothetical protein
MPAFQLSFEHVLALIQGRLGKTDIPCPLCSANRSTSEKRCRNVFRVWRDTADFLTFHCCHCGESGWLKPDHATTVDLAQISRLREQARQREEGIRLRRMSKARSLWRAALPIKGTPAEIYLRNVRGIGCPLPATLRFLPALRADYHPALVAAYGLPEEPEPGLLCIDERGVQSIQLTLLAANGSGKAKNAEGLSKISIGRSLGFPIVLAPPNDGLALAICEGIEDALSAHEATGTGAWASTGAKKLKALAPAVPSYLEAISIFVDSDADGRAGARALASALVHRCEVRLNIPDEGAAAA